MNLQGYWGKRLFCQNNKVKVKFLSSYFLWPNIQVKWSDSLIRADPLLIPGLCSGFVHLLLFLLLLVVYTLTVRQRRCSSGWSTRGMGGPHPADYARLGQAVLGRRLRRGRLQRIYSFLHTALSGSCVALPHRAHLLGVLLALLLILCPSIEIVIKGNDVGDFLSPPALFPQPWVWAEKKMKKKWTKTSISTLNKVKFKLIQYFHLSRLFIQQSLVLMTSAS